MDHKYRPLPCLPNVILCTGAKTEFSSPPVQRSTGFGELAAQAHIVSFLHRLAFKLFSENNWCRWRTKVGMIRPLYGVQGQEWQQRSGVGRKNSGIIKEESGMGWEDEHGLRPTIHYQRSWAHCLPWTAGVASRVFRGYVRDVQLINDSSFYHVILFSVCENERWPFSPLDEESRLRKFTLKSGSSSLLGFLASQVSNDHNGKHWELN